MSDHGLFERFDPVLIDDPLTHVDHHVRYAFADRLLPSDGQVLDAGCGTGWGTHLLSHGTRQVTGADIAVTALEIARNNTTTNAAFVQQDITALTFRNDQFDNCVSFEAIEHVADPSLAIAEICRVTANHGLVIISTPNAAASADENPFHLRELSQGELVAELQKHREHVVVLHQGFWVGTGVLSADEYEGTGSTMMHVDKLTGEPTSNAVTLIAVASDRSLQEIAHGTGSLGLAIPVAFRRWSDMWSAQRDYQSELESQLAELQPLVDRVNQLEAQVVGQEADLQRISDLELVVELSTPTLGEVLERARNLTPKSFEGTPTRFAIDLSAGSFLISSGVPMNNELRASISTLISLVLRRDDLRAGLTGDRHLDFKECIAWAANDTVRACDPDTRGLLPTTVFRTILEGLGDGPCHIMLEWN